MSRWYAVSGQTTARESLSSVHMTGIVVGVWQLDCIHALAGTKGYARRKIMTMGRQHNLGKDGQLFYASTRPIVNEDGIVISLGGPFDNGTTTAHPARIERHDFEPIIEAFPEYADYKPGSGYDEEKWNALEGLFQGARYAATQFKYDNGITVEKALELEEQAGRRGNPYY